MGKSRIDLIVRFGMIAVGFLSFTIGLVAFDWRIGAVVAGALLTIAGLYVPYNEE